MGQPRKIPRQHSVPNIHYARLSGRFFELRSAFGSGGDATVTTPCGHDTTHPQILWTTCALHSRSRVGDWAMLLPEHHTSRGQTLRMKIPRWTLRSAVLVAALVGGATGLAAQGVTTGAISGTVTNAQGQALEGTQIQVTNRNTGARAGAISRADGRYYVPSLEVGGPYLVSVRRIGFAPRDSVI